MDEQQIQQKRRENEETATAGRARILGLPYFDTREHEASLPLVWGLLPVEEMHRNFILPLAEGGGEEHYQFMVTSQTPRSLIQKMRQEYTDDGERVDFFLISNSGYRALMLRYDPPKEIRYDDIRIAGDGDSETIDAVSKTLNTVSSEQVFDFLIDQADKLRASDIHIENMRDTIRIRMRVDGLLHPVANIGRDKYRILMGELSSRANVSTAADRPQSGHMQKEVFVDGAAHILNIRVETTPTMYGQDAVLRLFNFDESLLNLKHLGLAKDEKDVIDSVIKHPRGMVLIVGPTGSGKSTTLYSMLNALNTPERKIITLEDPIEYSIPGISQIPITTNSGESFAEGLRSVLRLDPDVVMVGEIRDADTARTAIQASVTGHLVLSSFHADTAAAAFSRMIDLVGANPIFVSSIRLVVAQRLLRKLAPSKEARPASEAELDYIKKVLGGVPESVIGGKIDWASVELYDAVPTTEYPFGYAGRMVIMEQMVVVDEIKKMMQGGVAELDTAAIEKFAARHGMLTLEQRGVLAVLRGETTLDEVARTV